MAALSEVLDGLDLNTGGYRVAARDFGSPIFEPALVRRGRGMAERLVSLTSNGSRRLTYSFEMQGASTDATIALTAALIAKLPTRGSKNLVVAPTGATYAVTFVCLGIDGEIPSPYDLAFDVGHVQTLDVTFIAEPYAYGPETTLVSAASVTYPNVVDINVPGDLPTPLQVTFAGAGLHCLYAGLLPDQSLALPLWEAELLTWTGGTTASNVDAAAHGGIYRQNSDAGSAATAPVSDTALPAGTYKALGRISSDAGQTALFYAVSSATWLSDITPTWMLAEFPVLAHLPYLFTRAAVGSQHTVGMKPSSGNAYCDYYGLVPQTWGWMQWHPAAGTTVTAKLVHEYDGRLYAADLADAVNGRSGGLAAVGAQRLVVFADTAHGSAAPGGVINLTTTVKVKPRYALWR